MYAYYAKRLAGTPVRLPFLDGRRRAEHEQTAIHLLAAILPPGVDRTHVMAQLKEAGVQTSIHYPPVHTFTAYRQPRQDLPRTEALARRELSLPFYPAMTEVDVDLVVEILLAALAPNGAFGQRSRAGRIGQSGREDTPVIQATRSEELTTRSTPTYHSFDLTAVAAKRLFDAAIAGVALILAAPLFLAIAVLIKLDSPGPVFFRQARVGRHQRRFLMWKFRKMYDKLPTQGPSLTRRYDMRLTRVGRILERTKLDELPQLFNVLVGDMSVVGPRPEVPKFVQERSEHWDKVLSVKPGLVGPCQLRFRNESELFPAGCADLEAYYAEHILPRKLAVDAAYASRYSPWQTPHFSPAASWRSSAAL